MPTVGTPVAPPSVTVDVAVAYARFTIPIQLPELVPFVAKVHRVRTRRGKEYTILRMTLPKDVGEKLGVSGNDFLFALAQKAQWFHMIDWSQMSEAWGVMPPELKAVLVHYGLVTASGFSEAPAISNRVLSPTHLALPAASTPSNQSP